MNEIIVIRLVDHSVNQNGQQFSLEVSLPGRYDMTYVGASLEQFASGIATSLGQVFRLIGIPEKTAPSPLLTTVIPHIEADPEPELPLNKSGFAAQGTAKFAAQVIRNGVVVED